MGNVQRIDDVLREFYRATHEYLIAAGFPGEPFKPVLGVPISAGPVDKWIAARIGHPGFSGFVRATDRIDPRMFTVVRMRVESVVGGAVDPLTAWNDLRAFVDLLDFQGAIEPAVRQRLVARLDLLKPQQDPP